MKTLLIAFAFLLVASNAYANDGLIDEELHNECMKESGVTKAFCECAVNQIHENGLSNEDISEYLSTNDLIWKYGAKVHKFFQHNLGNKCSSKTDIAISLMKQSCKKSVDILEYVDKSSSIDEICLCRAKIAVTKRPPSDLIDFFSENMLFIDGEQELIAMLEGNNASVNAQCGG